MSFVRYLSFLILLRWTIALSQINLDFTNQMNENENNSNLQHDCIHLVGSIEEDADPYQIISFCMSEWPSKWKIQKNNFKQNFTFADLYKQNITTEQLYRWSAPLDIIEDYQLYLNELSSSLSSLSSSIFYNCTLPRFGPLCQYSMFHYRSYHSSLIEFISEYYRYEYDPTTLTCYNHLQCDRGSISLCLDWSEICDGTVDCKDAIDEQYCLPLEINQCEDNEYRCFNGQCIPMTFLLDGRNSPECLDRSDEYSHGHLYIETVREPTFVNEDVICLMRRTDPMVKLTSSCSINRNEILKQFMISDKPKQVLDECWLAVRCYLHRVGVFYPICNDLSFNRTWIEIINETCPDLFYMTGGPILFGHLQFVYSKEDFFTFSISPISPRYVCYNDQLCSGFNSSNTTFIWDNTTCHHHQDFQLHFETLGPSRGDWVIMFVLPLFRSLYQCNTFVSDDDRSCNNSMMYRCINSSKCIPKYRLCDKSQDCDYKDDEQCALTDDSCSKYGSLPTFKCSANVCIPLTWFNDRICHCGYKEYNYCADELLDSYYIKEIISFPTICDGFVELIPILVDGKKETDESECHHWQCNNTYTRCDGYWNCFNGADEIDCDTSPLIQCPHHHHICISSITNQLMCLPLKQANDGHIDCVGATDEPQLCRSDDHQYVKPEYYCNDSKHGHCIEYQQLCRCCTCNYTHNNRSYDAIQNISYLSLCDNNGQMRPDLTEFFKRRPDIGSEPKIVYFSLGKLTDVVGQTLKLNTDRLTSSSSITQQIAHQHQQRCHRGFVLRVWLDEAKNLTTETCLCPPSFYGNMCQYQNQRVSLTLQVQPFADSRRTLFTIIVLLIDNSSERLIHSYQQFTYLYRRDCQMKFNMYLLYLTRPKDRTKHYSIHVDVYEKISLKHRKSLLLLVKFPFLPVHRIAAQLNISRTNDRKEQCSNEQCLNGQCIRYSDNREGSTFCQCHRGWSGQNCTIPYNCSCSWDSLCIGILPNNRSICLCPNNKWGSRCLLQSTVCDSTTCYNNGQCIPTNERIISKKTFDCMCKKGFSGQRCEIIDKTMIISFHKKIILTQTIFVHFVRIIDNNKPEYGSAFKTIPFYQNAVTIHWSQPFHIVFIELSNDNYYLFTVLKLYNQSKTISKTIHPSDHCPHLREVLNENISRYHLIRRIKYYHLSCQQYQLSCFYDENYFCLCQQRLANCFEFNQEGKFNCSGGNNCLNGAKCFQDKPTCAQISTCICPMCFYGKQCEFNLQGYNLSLDAILGYHIQPHINIKDQPLPVQLSIGLTIIIVIAGLINGVLAIMTFKHKEAPENGCIIYLINSSIATLLIMIILTFKFWILLIAQMTYITNRLFLQFQCISIDFLSQISLNMSQWLNACVAIERAVMIIKGVGFNKTLSKKMAKYITLLLLILNIGTTIHDPLHRHITDNNDDEEDNENEQRIWCVVTYSSNLQIFNRIISLFHFLTPFVVNLISAPIIIIMTTRQEKIIKPKETYRIILKRQCRAYSHLLITPIILVVLAVPRLIISFFSGCMKSINDPWLYLIGYFISFIPPVLTFGAFVIPSLSYRRLFRKTYQQHKMTIQRRLHRLML